jgi:protein-disulfide isomerase
MRQLLTSWPSITLSLCLLLWVGCNKPKPVIPTSTTAEVYQLSSLKSDEQKLYQDLIETLPSPCGDPETFEASIKAVRCTRAVFFSRVLFRVLRDKQVEPEQLAEVLNRWFTKSNESRGMTFAIDVSKAPMFGLESAQVELIEFADFQCPSCAFFYQEIKQIKPQLATVSKFYFKNFPLSQHLNAEPAARAALAAHEQNKFWEYFALLFENQDQIAPDKFGDWAKKLDLDTDRFAADYASPKLSQIVAQDRQDGLSAGVDSTPSLYINKRRYYGPLDAASVWDAVLISLAEVGATTMPLSPQ